MVHIFYGRENVDKEKFIYGQIQAASKVRPRRTFVIVPDQYTLEGEKQAFRLLGVRGLMDVEVISMSRLGSRLLAEPVSYTHLDVYKRQLYAGSEQERGVS